MLKNDNKTIASIYSGEKITEMLDICLLGQD